MACYTVNFNILFYLRAILEGPGIESRWGEIFRSYPDRLRGPPSLLYNGYRFFSGGKGARGVMLTTHTLLVPRLRKSWAIPPLTLWVLQGLLRGSLYLYLYLRAISIEYDSNIPWVKSAFLKLFSSGDHFH